MELFHGSLQEKATLKTLTHLGTMKASIQRLESIYAAQAVKGDGHKIGYIDSRPIYQEPLDEGLARFVKIMSAATISAYELDIKNPLRLTDCWGDDPIGSAGFAAFKDNQQITSQPKNGLIQLLKPFYGHVYPHIAQQQVSKNGVKALKKSYEKNTLFQQELTKRKQRSKAIGMPWDKAEHQEIVWLDLTFKTLNWAKKEGYDSLVYTSDGEDKGSEAYVILDETIVKQHIALYQFNLTMFDKDVAPYVAAYAAQFSLEGAKKGENAVWGGKNPQDFWFKKTAP